jgi:hypothetical protein
MGDFKLPEINPIAVDRQPEMYERAGAQVNQAFQQGAEVASGLDKARVIYRAQEAQFTRQQHINDFMAAADRNSVPTKEEVQAMIGGDLPPTVEQMYKDAGDKGVEMFRILPHLAPVVAEKATTKAVQGIEGEGWKQKFQQAADMENLQLQAHVREKSTGMERMAMAMQGEAYYEDAMNKGNVEGMKTYAALNPDPATRAKRLAALPHDISLTQARGMLAPQGTPEERLEKLQAAKTAIENDEIIRPKDLPEGVTTPKRAAALTAPEKSALLHAASAQEKMIREEIYKGILAPADAALKATMNMPPQLARAYLAQNPVFIDPRLTFEDADRIDKWQKNVLAGKNILPDEKLYARLVNNGDELLRKYSPEQMDRLKYSFPPAQHEKLMDRWSKLRDGKDVESILTPRVSQKIKDTIATMVVEHKVDPIRFNLNEDNLAVAVMDEFKLNPNKEFFVTQAMISAAAQKLIARGDANTFGDAGYKDSDNGAGAAADLILQGRTPGRPKQVKGDERQALIADAYKNDGPIKAAFSQWAPEQSITKYDIVKIHGEATRRKTFWEDQIRREYVDKKQAPPADISQDLLLRSIVTAEFANVQSQEKHPAIRSALESARDREILQAQADKDAAAARAASAAERAKEKRDLFLQGGVR